MKKTILTTLIAAGISTAPLANELAKLNFATDSAAQAPAQKVVIQKKEAIKSTSQHTEDADTIPELIFDHTDVSQLAVLTPEEMVETEGATIERGPGGFGFGSFTVSEGAGMFSRSVVEGFAKGAAATQGLHYLQHGEFADTKSTILGGTIGSLMSARSIYAWATGTVDHVTKFTSFHNRVRDTVIFGATYPWISSGSGDR